MSTGFTWEDAISSLHATTWRVPRAGAGVRHPGLTLELAQVEGGCLKVSAPTLIPGRPACRTLVSFTLSQFLALQNRDDVCATA